MALPQGPESFFVIVVEVSKTLSYNKYGVRSRETILQLHHAYTNNEMQKNHFPCFID